MTGRPLSLGVLGGMGPAATAEFLRLLAARAPAATDQEHPRILLLSEPSIPDRTEALLSGDDAPLPLLHDGLLTLAGWGAEVLAVPCNTAHVWLDRIRAELPVPLVHIVEATLRATGAASPGGAWLAATTGTVASGIYQRCARANGYRLALPDATLQQRIHAAATLVKANRVPEAADAFRSAVLELRRRESIPVVTACTELPIAYAAAGLPPGNEVSSVAALATACTEALYRPGGPAGCVAATGFLEGAP